MTKDEIKSSLSGALKGLVDVQAEAHNLENKNLADILGDAIAKVQQATEHPDMLLLVGGPDAERERQEAEAKANANPRVDQTPGFDPQPVSVLQSEPAPQPTGIVQPGMPQG